MDGGAPPTRLVRCPRCRSVLPEVAGVPMYQCAVCETILLAKNFRSQGTSMASVDSVFNFAHTNEFDHGFESGSSDPNGKSVTLVADPAQSRDAAGNVFISDDGCHKTADDLRNEGNKGGARNDRVIGDESIMNENHSHSTDAGNNSNIEDACHETKDNMKNGGNETRSESGVGDEVLDPLGEQTTQDLNMQTRENMKIADNTRSEPAGNNPNIKDGCLETRMNMKNGGNVTRSESGVGDEVLDSGERTTQDLNFQNHETEVRDDSIMCLESETGDDAVRCLDVQLEKNLILGEDATKSRGFEDKKEEFVESSMQKSVSDENKVDGDVNNEASGRAISPTNTGSPMYEGSVSSFDGRYEDKSPRTQCQLQSRTRRPQSVPHSPLSDRFLGGASQEELHKINLVTEQLKMHSVSDLLGGCSSAESPSRHGRHSHGQEYSGLSEELLQNELSSSPLIGQNDSPSSKFIDIEHSRVELLRKVDNLRTQIMGSFDKTSDVDRKSQTMGRRQVWQSPQLTSRSSRESEHEFLVPSHPALRSKKYPTCCLNCHVLPPEGIFCNNGLCMSCCHTYCRPSNTADYHTHVLSSPLSSHRNLRHNNLVKLYPKMKDQTVKRHCRPISGGANFIICPECLDLLQMPDDFNISGNRRNKLRCGSCSQVVTITFPKKKHRSHIFEGNRGTPFFTYNEEYVPSSSGSYRMGNEQVLYRSMNSIDSRGESLVNQQSRLHQLMGYYSARDIIFEPSDCEEWRSRN